MPSAPSRVIIFEKKVCRMRGKKIITNKRKEKSFVKF